MKYYKLLVNGHSPLVVGKIYKEDYKFRENPDWTISRSVDSWPKDYVEVEEWEYYQQEGLPEKWCINGDNLKEELSVLNNYFNKLSNSDYFQKNYGYYHFPDILGNRVNTNYYKHTFILIKEGYTEISFETFKKLVLKEEQQNKTVNMEKKFVKIVDNGKSFDSHPMAKEYGMTNYHFWSDKPMCKNGDILEVVTEVNVNNETPSYILKDNCGIEYLINRVGVVDYKEEIQEKEIFGYKLKKDCKQYAEAVKNICRDLIWGIFDFDKDVLCNPIGVSDLTKAGVLGLWFEPVYKEEEFKVGDWTTLGLFESNTCAEEYLDSYIEESNRKIEDYRIIRIDK